ncbi:MAG: phytanoyl-CoA dioxygenase family protein [Bacteroidetes bacterium]|nr:phytanoyl-CoA dioxygenase family protein [Bacteroidota bacterium]
MIITENRENSSDVEAPFNRHRIPFFRDKSLQDKIEKDGFAVVQLLEPDDVAFLREVFDDVLRKLPGKTLPEIFWTSGRIRDPGLRNVIRQAMQKTHPKNLAKYFDPEIIDFVGGVFMGKSRSNRSRLYPHQDSSHLDERKAFSLYCWAPLQDVNFYNGAMQMLPGSHKFGNRFRSLNVPWDFAGYEDIMFRYMIQCPMKVGEAALFDAQTIHYSSDNYSHELRLACNYLLQPKDMPFLHYFIDKDTPPGKVETYHTHIDYFYDNMNFETERPGEPYKFLGYEDYQKLDLNHEKFENMCQDYYLNL